MLTIVMLAALPPDAEFGIASTWMLLLAARYLVDAVIVLGAATILLAVAWAALNAWRWYRALKCLEEYHQPTGPLFNGDGSLACICHHHKPACDCAPVEVMPAEPSP
jgi:hypothetical protein